MLEVFMEKGKLWVTPTAHVGNPFQFNVLFLFPLKPLENQRFLKFKTGMKSFYCPEMSSLNNFTITKNRIHHVQRCICRFSKFNTCLLVLLQDEDYRASMVCKH